MRHFSRLSSSLRAGLLLACVLVSADCVDSGGDDNRSGAGFDPAAPGGPGSPGSGRASTATAARECTGGCSSDLVAARAALEAGDIAGAYALYRCADTPEAAFGAGLTRVLSAVESDGGDALLADFGYGPMNASDLLGPDSIASRWGTRWKGQGQLNVQGDVELSTGVRVQQEIYEEPGSTYVDVGLEAVASDGDSRANLNIYFSGEPSELPNSGTVLSSSFDCATGSRTSDSGPEPNVDLTLHVEGLRYWCSAPFGVDPSSCIPDGGSVTIVEAGSQVGQGAAYEIDNLLLSCEVDEYDDEGNPLPGPDLMIRLDGSFEVVAVSSELDVEGLHEIFGDERILSAVPEGRTISEAIWHLDAVADQLVLASCYFDRASRGSGTVFTLPGVVHGGQDVTLAAGDAGVLSGLSALAAAAGHMGAAYEIDMPLRALVCDQDEDVDCPDQASFVSMFNLAFAQVFHAERFAAAEGLVGIGLERLSAGIGKLEADSVIVRNGRSSPGLERLQAMVDSGVDSLDRGETILPNVMPEILIDLQALFAAPPQRDGAGGDPLVYGEMCDEYGDCYEDTSFNARFWEAFIDGAIDADWDGSYEWLDEQMVTDSLDETAFGLRRAGFLVFN